MTIPPGRLVDSPVLAADRLRANQHRQIVARIVQMPNWLTSNVIDRGPTGLAFSGAGAPASCTGPRLSDRP